MLFAALQIVRLHYLAFPVKRLQIGGRFSLEATAGKFCDTRFANRMSGNGSRLDSNPESKCCHPDSVFLHFISLGLACTYP